MSRSAPPETNDSALRRAPEGALLLLALVLPWTIAPMGIATGLCAAVTLFALARGAFRWERTPVDAPALGWAVALLLSALFAVDRAGSLPRLGKMLFPAMVPLIATCAFGERAGRRAVAALLVSAVVAALFGLVVFVLKGASFASRARGPVGHYMTFAGQLLLFLCVAIGIAIAARERRWRLGALAASVPVALALLATFTRSAWIGLVVALGVMLGTVRPKLLPALVVAIALVTAFAPAPIRGRLTGLFDPTNDFNRERSYMWEAGGRMFRDHPLTGVGLMDLHPLYDRYRPPGAVERAGHLHSVPVQIAASMGVVGLVAFAALYTSLLWTAARGLRGALRAGGFGAGVKLGVTAALAGFLVAGLFEWNFGDEELLYPLFTLVGLAWAARGWGDAPPERGA
jgi:O-antigen ligase